MNAHAFYFNINNNKYNSSNLKYLHNHHDHDQHYRSRRHQRHVFTPPQACCIFLSLSLSSSVIEF